MIDRETNSQRVPPCSAREPRQSSTDCRGELHQRARHDRLIAPEAQNHGLHNFTDQSGTVVLIGLNFACLPDMGDFAVPMIFKSFHQPVSSQQEPQDNVAR